MQRLVWASIVLGATLFVACRASGENSTSVTTEVAPVRASGTDAGSAGAAGAPQADSAASTARPIAQPVALAEADSGARRANAGAGGAPEAGADAAANRPVATRPDGGARDAEAARPRADDAVVSVVARMPDEVRGGRPFTYQLVVENRGADALAAVAVRETLGTGLTFVSAEPAPARVEEGVLVFEIGALPPREPRTLAITATPSAGESVTRSAAVDVRVVRATSARVVTPQLALVTHFDAGGTLLCDDVRGHFTVSNPGNGRTEDVVVRCTLPAGWTLADGGSSARFDVGVLEAGASADVPFAWRAQRAGAFTLSATATARGDLTAESLPVSAAVHEPRLELEIVGPGADFTAGRPGVLRFRATNATDVAVDGARLVATVPAALTFDTAEAGGVRDGERCTWTLGTLQPGETREVTAAYRASAPLSTNVRAELAARCVEQVRATAEVTVLGAVDLSLRFTDASGVARVGEPQEYTCKLENLGQVALTDLRVAASWPAQMEWVDSAVTPAPFVAGERAEFVVGTLGVGEERTFTFRLRARAAGTFKTNALATSAETPRPVSQDEVSTFLDR